MGHARGDAPRMLAKELSFARLLGPVPGAALVGLSVKCDACAFSLGDGFGARGYEMGEPHPPAGPEGSNPVCAGEKEGLAAKNGDCTGGQGLGCGTVPAFRTRPFSCSEFNYNRVMPRDDVFGNLMDDYEAWFLRHAVAYASELRAVRKVLPKGKVLEVGVGTGRFSAPVGVPFGLDPSLPMLRLARRRGIRVAAAVGESLPIKTGALDGVLFITTLCFLEDPEGSLLEARRAMKPGGILICAFVDARSPLGKEYAGKKEWSRFNKEARFFGVEEVHALVEKAGFSIRGVFQTLFKPLEKLVEPEDPRPGYGDGSFVVLQAVKP